MAPPRGWHRRRAGRHRSTRRGRRLRRRAAASAHRRRPPARRSRPKVAMKTAHRSALRASRPPIRTRCAPDGARCCPRHWNHRPHPARPGLRCDAARVAKAAPQPARGRWPGPSAPASGLPDRRRGDRGAARRRRPTGCAAAGALSACPARHRNGCRRTTGVRPGRCCGPASVWFRRAASRDPSPPRPRAPAAGAEQKEPGTPHRAAPRRARRPSARRTPQQQTRGRHARPREIFSSSWRYESSRVAKPCAARRWASCVKIIVPCRPPPGPLVPRIHHEQ